MGRDDPVDSSDRGPGLRCSLMERHPATPTSTRRELWLYPPPMGSLIEHGWMLTAYLPRAAQDLLRGVGRTVQRAPGGFGLQLGSRDKGSSHAPRLPRIEHGKRLNR